MLGFTKTFVALCMFIVSSNALVPHEKRSFIPSGFVNNGPAPNDQVIELQVALASTDMDGLQSKLLTISDPASVVYGQWLSQAEIKSFVAPSPATVSAFQAWAAANNIKSSIISPNEEWVSITTTVSQANELFGASFDKFTHTPSNTQVIRTTEFSLPEALVGHVNTIHPTTDFSDPDVRLTPTFHWQKKDILNKRQVAASCNNTITPSCLESIYGIPTTLATQKSNTLLVTAYVQQFAETADLKSFLSQFQPLIPSTTTFTTTSLDGGANTQNPADAGVEADLDTQYTVGIALGVPVTFLTVGGNNFNTALLDTTRFLAGVASPPSVMTTSYGENENSLSASLATQICNGYMALGARGISVVFASGDGGVRGNHDTLSQCTSNTFIPVFPAACPFVTSVGSTIGINPERAINFTGGGFSNTFTRPSYQSTVVPAFLNQLPANFVGTFNKAGRGYPDVSLQGWNFEVVAGGETGLVGGTSASSPSFASIIALINDRLVAAGKPILGFLNPFIYSTASSAFTDITIGKNVGFTCPSNSSAFTAATGWDPLTGFGTPVFSKLLAAAGL